MQTVASHRGARALRSLPFLTSATLVTLFKLNYLLMGLISKYRLIDVEASTYKFERDTIQFTMFAYSNEYMATVTGFQFSMLSAKNKIFILVSFNIHLTTLKESSYLECFDIAQ